MSTAIASVRAELRTDTTDVATATPRLSWTTTSSTNGWTQASAELELDGTTTVTLSGSDSVLVPWPFAELRPRTTHHLRVRTTSTEGDLSQWSEPLEIVAAFSQDDWKGAMIGLTAPAEFAEPALLRKEFDVPTPITRATLYATAHGTYQVEINGSEVDDQILKPGWTPYQYRLVHETTDVTALITAPGRNAIGATVAGGWYTEKFGFAGNAMPFYGSQPALTLVLVLDHADGSTSTIVTDDTWRAHGGPITSSGIYQGESYDARLELKGWTNTGFDDSAWTLARVDTEPFPAPTPRNSPAVRVIETLSVKEVINSAKDEPILDFGQNLVGRLRIKVSGPAGTKVTLRHAEVLEHGELGVRPLRFAKATDTYILKGAKEEIWAPRFTFHGFRYAQIDGLIVDPGDVIAEVIHSDMQRTGWFESSHELLNRLHENVVWGMRGNFLYLPTDCPQRDERLGWTGDIQVFSPTASFLYGVDGFLSSWLTDLDFDQKAQNGVVPFVVPNVLEKRSATPAAAWGDAATVVPSVLYQRFGDAGVLRQQFASMKAWTDALIALAGDRRLWEDHFQFGDWLDPSAPPENAFAAKTDPDIIATGYLFKSVTLVAEAAAVLGLPDESAHYANVASKIQQAFNDEYVTPAGRLMSDTQTGYALAIMFGLVADDATRATMGARLAALVRANGYRIGTGFVGTPLINDALTETGHQDTAGRLLTETSNPSWLYPVTMGATTVWERWDSMLEDGSINPGEMTSFNHYALGAVADWLHRSVAGLAPAQPGYRVIRVAPQPIRELTRASATHETPYGLARVGWTRQENDIVIEAVIPANSFAEVQLPDGSEPFKVGSGNHTWTVQESQPQHQSLLIDGETRLSDVIGDTEAYQRINDAIQGADQNAARVFRIRTQWTPGRRLNEVLWQLPKPARDRVEAALENLRAERSSIE